MHGAGSTFGFFWGTATARSALIAVVMLLAQVELAGASDSKAASLILDANTGRTLHAYHIDEPRYPASLTKMMTLYMVFDAIKQGRAKTSTLITVSERAAAAPPSKIGFEPGDKISLKDAMLALVTKSANDVAIAVAEHFSGSERRFASAMTAKARMIGLNATTFRNASGLPDPGQTTTARDMVTLALRIFDDHPDFYPVFATRSFSYRGKRFNNHNGLLRHFTGTEGMKTGYIRASGFNVVTSVRRGHRHLIGAYFGAQTAGARDSAMRALLTKALLRASTRRTRRSGPILVAQPRRATRPVEVARAAPPAPTSDGRITMVNVRSVPVDPPGSAAPVIASRPSPPPVLRPSFSQTEGPPPAPARVEPRHGAATPAVAAAAPLLKGRGRAPSTLAAQAQLLSGEPTSSDRMSIGVRSAAYHPASQGTYEIQISAHRSKADAENALRAVQARAGQLLAGAPGFARATVTSKGATVYRSRFTGFESERATSTCLELRRLSIDCYVARPD